MVWQLDLQVTNELKNSNIYHQNKTKQNKTKQKQKQKQTNKHKINNTTILDGMAT